MTRDCQFVCWLLIRVSYVSLCVRVCHDFVLILVCLCVNVSVWDMGYREGMERRLLMG